MQIHVPKTGAGIGPCMDVKAHDGLLYAIQNDEQHSGGHSGLLKLVIRS